MCSAPPAGGAHDGTLIRGSHSISSASLNGIRGDGEHDAGVNTQRCLAQRALIRAHAVRCVNNPISSAAGRRFLSIFGAKLLRQSVDAGN